MVHALIRVASEADWRTYHTIRRTVLWEERGLRGYGETRAEERLPDHHPLLLMFNAQEFARQGLMICAIAWALLGS